jgi:hypothetical protein
MKHSEARYEMLCDCGAWVEYARRRSKDSRAVTAVREVCPNCTEILYGHNVGEKAYKPRPATLELHWDILDVFADIEPPMTVRQMYYQLSARQAVDKTENGYNKVQRALTDMRRAGAIPYGWLSDNSRSIYRTEQYPGLEGALEQMHAYYRRDIWRSQGAHIEIWLEKRALISQIWPICNEYGVTLFPCGGYSSISFAYEAAEAWEGLDKPIFIYHLSDLDADGAYSSVVLERELREHTGHPITFRRLALDPQQVKAFGLHDAQRPQKKTSTRFRWWTETYGDMQACELDALHPNTLRALVREAIEAHIDLYELARLREIEQEERRSLGHIIENLADFTAAI